MNPTFHLDLPLADLRPGDYVRVLIPTKRSKYGAGRKFTRTAEAIEIVGPIVRVLTKTREGLVAVPRADILKVWGYR